MEAHSVANRNPFTAATEAFNELVNELSEKRLMSAQHGMVEAIVTKKGREVLRRLFQGHLDLRAPAVPEGERVTDSEGNILKYRREDMHRPLTTLFGTVQVHRIGYRGRDGGALKPLDAVLNLPPDKYSHGVRRQVATLVAKTSFEDAAATMSEQTGAPVPKRQVEDMAQSVSADFDAYYEQRRATVVEDSASLLVLGFDGTGVHMRPEALREATRKKREDTPNEDRWPAPMKTGPKRNNGTRSAIVSVCYEITPYPRTQKDILRDLRGIKLVAGGSRTPRPKPQAKRVSASLEKSVREAIGEGFEEALRRDPEQKKRWVVLLDGNEHQLETVQAQAHAIGADLTIVMDMIHVAGYVWGAAKVLYPDDFAERREWVMDKLSHILSGEANVMAAAMRRSATLRKLGRKKREPVDLCANYLLKYQAHLRYDEALAAGLPITTGAIEGTCRHLVKDRMAKTGARWGLDGGESVLRLRAIALTGDVDDYLEFHKTRELERNHLSDYEHGEVPRLESPGKRKPLLSVVK